MKKKMNELATLLVREIKTRPEWMTGNLYEDVKAILLDFKTILVNEFLSKQELQIVTGFISIGLDTISSEYKAEDVFLSNCYIFSIMEKYLDRAITYELYETSNNIKIVLEHFSPKEEEK